MASKTNNTPIIIGAIAGAILLVGLSIYGNYAKSADEAKKKEESSAQAQEEPKEEPKQEETKSEEPKTDQMSDDGNYVEVTANGISADDFAKYCQEDYIILKNLLPSGRDIALINVWDYRLRLLDTKTYTQDGDKIYTVLWYGKDKDLDKAVSFACYVSGKDKDHIVVHQVKMNGDVLDGILIQYNSEGNIIE